MLAKRLIPCLDVDAGRVVKGTRFQDLQDAGDPVELAAHYDREGADELVFLDITATLEGRAATLDVISRVAEQVFIPLTVGGGVRDEDDVDDAATRGRRQGRVEQRRRARSGAAAALRRPVRDPVHGDRDRRQAIGRRQWEVFVDAGGTATGATPWRGPSRPPRSCGAGEVLLTSMDRDGTGEGYDLDLLRAIADAVRVPVVASGGAGDLDHFAEALTGWATPMRCSPPAGCTSGNSRSARSRSTWRRSGLQVRT